MAPGARTVMLLWRKDSDGPWGIDSIYTRLGLAFTAAQAVNQLLTRRRGTA